MTHFCTFCQRAIDTRTNTEHFPGGPDEICIQELEHKYEEIERNGKRYFHRGGSLEYTIEDGDLVEDGYGHGIEFEEALLDQEEEERLDHKYPDR